MLTKYDRLLIYFLLFLSFLTFLASAYWTRSFGKETKKLVITDGKTTKEYSLTSGRKRIFSVKGCVVEIERAKVRVRSSSCPKKICVSQGWIRSDGESIVCLPHQVVIKIVGNGKETPFDSLVR